MTESNLIFQDEKIRKMFLPKNLIGKNIYKNNYKKVFKNENLLKVLNSKEINDSVDAFLCGGLNLTTASQNSFVHRNTLIYRITKIKKLIGLDIKDFRDAVVFINAREVFSLLTKLNNNK